MNNLPENENNTPVEEFSTVFSDPTEHKEIAKKSGSKRVKIAVSLCVAVAVLLGSTIAVIKLIPEKEVAGSSNSDAITVLDYETDEIKEVTVENQNGTFEFYCEKEESEAADTSEAIINTYWYIKGYDKEMTDSDLICNVVENVVSVDAIRKITQKTSSECGLEKPLAKAEFTTLENEQETLLIGAKSPDNSGVYVKLGDEENIYLVGEALDTSLNFTDLDLASTKAQGPVMLDEKYADYCSGVAVIKSDFVTVEGVNFNEKMVFAPTDEQEIALFTPYEVVKPMKRTAENVEILFKVFTDGFNTSGAYSYDVKDETVKALGLDKPDYVLSAIFDDYTYSYKFKQQEDGDYAVIGNDSKNIKRVSISDCGFLSYTTTDFYSKSVFVTAIDEISNLTIKTEDKTYSFDIRENPTGDEIDKYIIECDGKTYNSTYFQSYYEYLCMLQCIDFTTENVSAQPELTITYTYNDKNSAPTKIDFVKESAVRYQYVIDGVPMGKIGSSDYKKILKNLERLLDGKQVVVN